MGSKEDEYLRYTPAGVYLRYARSRTQKLTYFIGVDFENISTLAVKYMECVPGGFPLLRGSGVTSRHLLASRYKYSLSWTAVRLCNLLRRGKPLSSPR